MALTDSEKTSIEQHKAFISGVVKDGQTEYGKQILALSTSVLALSVAFIKNIIGDHAPDKIAVLYLSWGAFVIAIASVLGSIQASITAHKKYQKELEERLSGKTVEGKISCQEKLVPHLNRASSIAFGLGLILLIIFAALNLKKGKDMSNKWTGANDSVEVQRVVVTGEVRECVEVQRAPTPPPPAPVPAPAPEPASSTKK